MKTDDKTRSIRSPIALLLGGITILSALSFAADAAAQTATRLLASGPAAQKRNLVIIGDGFQAADQTAFNDYVDTQVLQGVFGNGPLWESANAFNIIRVNVDSTDSGVTQVDGTGAVTTARTTALDYRFSGNWNRCWMEGGPNTSANIASILDSLVPERDFVFVVLNEANFGGCAGGAQLAVTLGANFTVAAHEMGHMVGNLCDEYTGGATPGNYTGGEPGCVNLTIDTNRATLKWRVFVDPATALPTTFDGTTMDGAETAGAFEGGTLGNQGFSTGLWRPSVNSRMNSNVPPFGPINYDRMKSVLDAQHDHDFVESLAGDFDGDGDSDLVVHNANALELYLSTGAHVAPSWVQTFPLAGWDSFLTHDRFFVGDFDGDGLDDLYVVNFEDWAIPYFAMLRSTGAGFELVHRYDGELPGWDAMRAGDRFFVADFDGDAKDDLYVFNHGDWAVGYLALLKSTGNALQLVRRYDDKLPGWDSMKAQDQFFVADVNRDGRKDLYVFNYGDWDRGYLEVLRSTGTELRHVQRYDGSIWGWGAFLGHDRFHVADIEGDGDDDLYVFNGDQWSMPYLAAIKALKHGLLLVTRRWDGFVEGWDRLAPNDRFYVADVDGDQRDDLYVYNGVDWATEYLGVLVSRPFSSLLGSWQADRIGQWDLRAADQFVVGDWSGGGDTRQDLFVHNDIAVQNESLGLLFSEARSTRNAAVYPNWIHQYEFRADSLWVTLP